MWRVRPAPGQRYSSTWKTTARPPRSSGGPRLSTRGSTPARPCDGLSRGRAARRRHRAARIRGAAAVNTRSRLLLCGPTRTRVGSEPGAARRAGPRACSPSLTTRPSARFGDADAPRARPPPSPVPHIPAPQHPPPSTASPPPAPVCHGGSLAEGDVRRAVPAARTPALCPARVARARVAAAGRVASLPPPPRHLFIRLPPYHHPHVSRPGPTLKPLLPSRR